MSIMHCCGKYELAVSKFKVSDNGFTFNVSITYCKNCGSKKAVGSGVSDGKSV
jgi:hypothetical protein